LTILGRIKRLKLKIVGLCFIFILTTPALLPTISSSINQAITTQKSNDSTNSLFISYFLSQNTQLSSSQEVPEDAELGNFSVLVTPYIHGFLIGGWDVSKLSWDGKESPIGVGGNFPIWLTQRQISFMFQTVVMPLYYPIQKVYSIKDITNQTSFDEMVFIWFGIPTGQINYGIYFPPVCFAHDMKIYQKITQFINKLLH